MSEPSDEEETLRLQLHAECECREATLRQQLQDTERENIKLRAKVADLFQADTINLLDAKLKTAYERCDALNATGAAVRAALQGMQVPDGMELGRAVRLVLAVTKEDLRLAKVDLRRAQKDVHDLPQELVEQKAKTVEWRSRYTRDVSGERMDARDIRERVRHERHRERVKVCDELLAFLNGLNVLSRRRVAR